MPAIIGAAPPSYDGTFTPATPSPSRGKLSSRFDALANRSARRLRRRPQLPFVVMALPSADLFFAIPVEDRQLQAETLHRHVAATGRQLGTRLSTRKETLSAAERDIGNARPSEKRLAASGAL